MLQGMILYEKACKEPKATATAPASGPASVLRTEYQYCSLRWS